MILSDMLAAAARGEPVAIPPEWMQGRTAYGGLSTALAHAAAKAEADDVPSLRSAQIAFVAPAAGEVSIMAKLLRRGKNSAFVDASIADSQGNVALRGSFIFASPRASAISFTGDRPGDIPARSADKGKPHPLMPTFFAEQIEFAATPLQEAYANGRTRLWVRLKDRENLDPVAEILTIGDALPPAMIGLLPPGTVISSMNWQIDLVTQQPETEDGWWFLESRVIHAADGASSQFMMLYNSRGERTATGMQAVGYYVK